MLSSCFNGSCCCPCNSYMEHRAPLMKALYTKYHQDVCRYKKIEGHDSHASNSIFFCFIDKALNTICTELNAHN